MVVEVCVCRGGGGGESGCNVYLAGASVAGGEMKGDGRGDLDADATTDTSSFF